MNLVEYRFLSVAELLVSRFWTKVCGITRSKDAQIAEAFGACALGVIFYEPSPRHVSPSCIGEIFGNVSNKTERIGLFVNPSAELVNRVLDTGVINYLQFHGEENEDFCASFQIPYMKALRVKDGGTALKSARAYRSADRILLDTYVENLKGGTGKTMDWTQAALVTAGCDKPVVLAGGLDGNNVGEAIRIAAPAGVDVSSGVEESPGIKNVNKLKSFFDGVYRV
ncbi:MAG TPA: phosphoribosylanthranilate isomerase [Gammaproteobacteria bacterium]|nr:phosphoribosylanthranilate isomerase [Gammaproteobacteria bacterium]